MIKALVVHQWPKHPRNGVFWDKDADVILHTPNVAVPQSVHTRLSILTWIVIIITL